MKIKYTKVTPDVVKVNRNFYKNHVKKAFVAWCAYEGYFDGVLTDNEIERAKKGCLPEDLNVHHKVPLSGTHELFVNDFTNLTVIHKRTHEFINRYVFAPQIRPLLNEPYGTEIEIEVPDYDYVDVEGITKERRYKEDVNGFRARRNIFTKQTKGR